MVQQVSRPPVPDAVAPIDPRVDPSVLAARLSDERAPDIVEALNAEAPEVAAAILLGLPHDRAIEVLDQPELDDAADIIEMLPRDRVAISCSGMSADRVTDVVPRDRGARRARTCARASTPRPAAPWTGSAPTARRRAGSLMTTEFVSVPGTWTVAQTLDHVRSVEKTRETIYAIYVLDPRTRALHQGGAAAPADHRATPTPTCSRSRRPAAAHRLADGEPRGGRPG